MDDAAMGEVFLFFIYFFIFLILKREKFKSSNMMIN